MGKMNRLGLTLSLPNGKIGKVQLAVGKIIKLPINTIVLNGGEEAALKWGLRCKTTGSG